MWVKICANTNLDDAQRAIHLGADAVGFVFAPSSRRVTPAQVAAIIRTLAPEVERIGVFQTHDPQEILEAVEQANLTGAQLHGVFDPDLIRHLGARHTQRLSLIPVIHWNTTLGAASPAGGVAEQLRILQSIPAVDRVLVDSRIDSRTGTQTGGTGVVFDWSAATKVLTAELGRLRLILAGGLRPDNLDDAVKTLLPWGVDVASGVEASPGNKDPQKLEAFLRKASLY